jgi:hypothetical protein
MRNIILGVIGVLWGGAIVVSGVANGVPSGGAYGTGQLIGFLFGVALLGTGGWTLLKRARS